MIFAEGLCFEKLIWILLIFSVLGCGVETVYCRLIDGYFQNRSSLAFGHFSLVWGIGAVIFTLILDKYKGCEDRYIFLVGFLGGGIYEYMCSLLIEKILGTKFWDYSNMKFNIHGRTNLLYMFFWGVICLIWIKILYQLLSDLVESIPVPIGNIVTFMFIVLFIIDVVFTALVLHRYRDRSKGIVSNTYLFSTIDKYYPDEKVEDRWKNILLVHKIKDSMLQTN